MFKHKLVEIAQAAEMIKLALIDMIVNLYVPSWARRDFHLHTIIHSCSYAFRISENMCVHAFEFLFIEPFKPSTKIIYSHSLQTNQDLIKQMK